MSERYLGVDLGGTKILAALVDERGRVLVRERAPTPEGGPEAVIGTIVDRVHALCRRAGQDIGVVRGLGVGAPGPMDPLSGVVFEPPNLPGWRDVPLGQLLSASLGIAVFVENDANAAALAEHWVGAGVGVDDLIYMTVSTGIGGGLILGGRLYHGAAGTAGEVGHMVIEPGGPRCNCGRFGCLEALASGPSIAREARAAVAAGRPTVLAAIPSQALNAAAVARAALDGDPVAREIYARAAAALGTGITNLVNLLNPAMVILGGGVTRAGELIFAPVRRIVRQEAFERPASAVQIVPAALGDDVGAIGAAAVVRDRLAERGGQASPL
ncbi:MAG: ROK family protein [Armatimonadota bacterium]|nr:ROK family protein [Armatimonadota bacterium]